MSKKSFYLIIVILILVLLGGAAYFFFYLDKPASEGSLSSSQSPFNPFSSTNTNSNRTSSSNNHNASTSTSSSANNSQTYEWPKIREIWPTPVGGFVASTTASSTFVRFVDRGTGYVYDMNMASATPVVISNTTVPLVYESYWSSNAMSGVFRYIKEGSDDITNFYVQLRSTATTTRASASSSSTSSIPVQAQPMLGQTPYELRGTYFPGDILSSAVSPNGNQLFTVENVEGNGAGFISNFDGSKSTQIFSAPLTQIKAFWPTANTLMLATKGSANSAGYLYSINAKTGTMSTILGNLYGLSVLPNTTGGLVLYSDLSTRGNLVASLYDIKKDSSQDLPFTTLADKCVWSKQNPSDLFCAVPVSAPTATYPDAWYEGTASTIDQIIEIDTDTGSTHLVSNLSDDANASIDAEWLALDQKERFLYFVNKNNLSLWSIDLNQ